MSGDLYVSSTYNMSDKTLKADITPLTGALEMVQKITGCTFVWNDHAVNESAHRVGQKTVGVIAQEVDAAGDAAKLCVTTNPETCLMAVGRGGSAGKWPRVRLCEDGAHSRGGVQGAHAGGCRARTDPPGTRP